MEDSARELFEMAERLVFRRGNPSVEELLLAAQSRALIDISGSLATLVSIFATTESQRA